ncbi:hypothetical protein BO86DRAFT_433311 [Aspergillus japonicus CBS 114.51]|uniref:Methyltransferase n=1 Tax=Aspergillus japonicus CBS 114.51 TaxID=1448312 RepID=A0A8T8WXJ9_ASPJA|nr:hypothetical protein BO86DRAFT_433311 [Aspergillus japonicus CBS 114.51]RAH80553.1 hypothetical protein BO86DRAFT_433311 [Aspergillus japonicus CBS 114.51]
MPGTLVTRNTTGKVGMWNGTRDGENAYIDHANGSTNIKPPKEIDITVTDLRSVSPQPTHASKGYQVVRHTTSITPEQFLAAADTEEGKATIEAQYYPEVQKLVTEVTGAAIVIPFGFRVRQQNLNAKNVFAAKSKGSSLAVAHVDRDLDNGFLRLQNVVGAEEAERLVRTHRRWASVNVWRSIDQAVKQWPLLLINHEKIEDWHYDTHMERLYTINDPSEAETGGKDHDTVLKFDPRYEYYFASDLDVDEALVFSSFDTDVTKVVPHGAFWDNDTPEDAPTRRSIEARSFVFWDPIEA